MYPQPKKWPRYLVGAIVLVFVFKDPTTAAYLVSYLGELISQGADALSEFASAIRTS